MRSRSCTIRYCNRQNSGARRVRFGRCCPPKKRHLSYVWRGHSSCIGRRGLLTITDGRSTPPGPGWSGADRRRGQDVRGWNDQPSGGPPRPPARVDVTLLPGATPAGRRACVGAVVSSSTYSGTPSVLATLSCTTSRGFPVCLSRADQACVGSSNRNWSSTSGGRFIGETTLDHRVRKSQDVVVGFAPQPEPGCRSGVRGTPSPVRRILLTRTAEPASGLSGPLGAQDKSQRTPRPHQRR